MKGMFSRELILRVWAVGSYLLIIFAAAGHQYVLDDSTESTILGDVAAASGSMIVLGFYFRMIADCIARRNVPRKWVWGLMFVVLPIASAPMYFMWTRSALKQAN